MIDGTLLAARLLLAAVFLVAGIAKLFDREGSRKALLDFGVPPALVPWLVVTLPIAECLVAVALLPLATAWLASIAALSLLLLFTIAIGVNLARGRTPDCHCFGQLHSAPAGASTLIRNGLLAAVAGFVVWNGSRSAGLSLIGGFVELSLGQKLSVVGAIALLSFCAVQAMLLFQILRQQGRLLLRLEALENQRGDAAPAEPAPAGLSVGTTAPDFQLKRADSKEEVSLQSLLQADTSLLLFFTNPKCGPCLSLMPEITQRAKDKSFGARIVLISEGTAADNLAKIAGKDAPQILLQNEREVAEAYQAYGTPGAVLVLSDGTIGSPLALGIDAVRSLMSKPKTPLPAAKLGEEPPQVELQDRDRKTVSLRSFRGSPTMLLFWNPGCGFCQQMLNDLEAWDADPPPGAPRLVVLSSGTEEQNRAMQLRAPIMTDPSASLGSALGATGTPMAVLLDAEGRVASHVAAGAQAVFALAESYAEAAV